jgi:hypothetical protein
VCLAELTRFAPIVMQETAARPKLACWDRPAALDADGSGTLGDDADRVRCDSQAPIPLYASAAADESRLYLFYGLYYTADWSGSAYAVRVDHRGDFEGALVVVDKARDAVEAIVTQAHKKVTLWPAPPLSPEGRPLLFAESGGHGLYAWGGDGEALVRLSEFAIRPLADIEPFTDPGSPRFKELPRGATPPWHWRFRGSAPGAIVRDPAALYQSLRRR